MEVAEAKNAFPELLFGWKVEVLNVNIEKKYPGGSLENPCKICNS